MVKTKRLALQRPVISLYSERFTKHEEGSDSCEIGGKKKREKEKKNKDRRHPIWLCAMVFSLGDWGIPIYGDVWSNATLVLKENPAEINGRPNGARYLIGYCTELLADARRLSLYRRISSTAQMLPWHYCVYTYHLDWRDRRADQSTPQWLEDLLGVATWKGMFLDCLVVWLIPE